MTELISILKFLVIINESGFFPKPLSEQELRQKCRESRGKLFCSIAFETSAQATNFWKYIKDVYDLESPEPKRNQKKITVQLLNE